MDILSIINDTKKDFTRERASAINEFLSANANSVVISYIKKTRGDAIRFYCIKDGKKYASEYVLKNAKILIKALKKNSIKIYQYNNGTISEYNNEF